MEKKYELTDEILEVGGHVLHRIKALRDFGNVKKGDIGGWIECEDNLSHGGDCWVYDKATVRGDATVRGEATVRDNATVWDNATVRGEATVRDNATVRGDATVWDNATVRGEATVRDNATVRGDAEVENKSDSIVFKNWWSSGRYFTWTRSNDMWSVGCFYGTGEELIKKAYNDSDESGREYKRIVKYVESIKQELK